jgi:methionine-rich copper-binding protein CopC
MSVKLPEDLNQPELSPDFEQRLTQALRHVAPPDGFADRILAQAQPAAPVHAKVLTMPSRLRLWASGAIAATLLVAGITQQIHARHQRQQAERAQQQFDAAMRITDTTLDHVRQQLEDAGVQIDH